MVPALVILALWTALLGPGAARWLRGRRPTTSIASFHRQLRKLERSGPKLVEPAHRLEEERRSETEQEQRQPQERPQLVLLRTGATEKEHTMSYDGRYDDDYVEPAGRHRRGASHARPEAAREVSWDDGFDEPELLVERRDPPTRAYRTVRAPRPDEFEDDLDDERGHLAVTLSPARAKARRSRILLGLAGVIAGSLLLGLVTGLTMLFAVTVLGVVGLAAYLMLMYYASNVGLYGGATEKRTPVARVVLPAYRADPYELDDEGWETERIAAAR